MPAQIVKTAEYWAHVRAVVDAAPPLTASQKDVLRRLFLPVLRELADARAKARGSAA